uniref:Uncharacterized protein n=1 Tax=Anguilla anguilla TaxID=7936 RepID=A0A0E9XHL8_ANGAN
MTLTQGRVFVIRLCIGSALYLQSTTAMDFEWLAFYLKKLIMVKQFS